MDLPIRRLLRPRNLDEALRLLGEYSGSLPLAGGTDLVVQLRDGRRSADTIVDIGALDLTGIDERDGGLEIGAATRMDTIAREPRVRAGWPSLMQAAALVGAWPIQCRATIGGNLANASPAADTAPPLLVAGALLRLQSAQGIRTVRLDEFFAGPGQSILAPGEIIVSVVLPGRDGFRGERAVERFGKVGPRREQIISVVSFAGRVVVGRDGHVHDVALALGSVAPTPVRARNAEACLAGRPCTTEARHEAAAALQEDIAPIDDVRAPASYRRMAAAVMLDRFLMEVTHG
jgi:carbon-monoxide dehydrogenase medium subunit